MANYILFGMYICILFGIFGFLAIFLMGIRNYKKYSRYITFVIRMYLITIVAIAIFGASMILSGTIFPQSKSPIQRINL